MAGRAAKLGVLWLCAWSSTHIGSAWAEPPPMVQTADAGSTSATTSVVSEPVRPAAVAAAGKSGGLESSQELLESHLALLAKRRLAPVPARAVDELDALLDEAHQRTLSGRKDEAARLLLEAVEGPRFRAFEPLDSFAAADLALASLLIDQHALTTAQRSVDRLLARGTSSSTFGPAHRRAVDIALARRDYARAAETLAARGKEPLPQDAKDELGYLRALAAYDAGREADAQRELGAVSRSSRFYPAAQYLLGTMAARTQRYDEAHQHFCAVREIVPPAAPRALYGAPQLVPSDDDARLGLARIEHERGRSKQAFDHYFSVPADSPLLAEALFESAYASYERGHETTALDSLDQLEARYPRSPFTAEARVLRGYAHLGRCDFERAERELVAFEQTFGEVLRELDATMESPTRTHGLYETARERERGAKQSSLLEALVSRDPEVERLRAALAGLDGELARSGNTGAEFAALAQRVRGGEARHARREPESDESRIAALRTRLSDTRRALREFGRELRALQRAGADRAELSLLAALERTLMKQSERSEAELRALVRSREQESEQPGAQELAERLEQERAYVEAVHSRGARVREELVALLEQAERRALGALRERLAQELRRARIGRIDAVMGKKRKLELEVESLTAGRFPPELASRKQTPVLLRDDEEYWPYEGEGWSDEFSEPAGLRKAGSRKAGSR